MIDNYSVSQSFSFSSLAAVACPLSLRNAAWFYANAFQVIPSALASLILALNHVRRVHFPLAYAHPLHLLGLALHDDARCLLAPQALQQEIFASVCINAFHISLQEVIKLFAVVCKLVVKQFSYLCLLPHLSFDLFA